jgi:hypothetical protein
VVKKLGGVEPMGMGVHAMISRTGEMLKTAIAERQLQLVMAGSILKV